MKTSEAKILLTLLLLGLPFFVFAQSGSTAIYGDSSITGGTNIVGSLSKGSGSFVIDHPLKPKTHLLYHSFVESPDVKNIYDGIVTLNRAGEASIELPWYFSELNSDYRYLATAISEPMPNLYLKRGVRNNEFKIAGGEPGGRVSWQVTGIRKDPYILANPIVNEVEKGQEELVDKGQYLHPDVF